jgi:hypothetical protein
MTAALAGRISKGDCYALILNAFIDNVGHDTARKVCELLGITGKAGHEVSDPTGDLARFAATSEPSRLRAAVAVAMVHAESRFEQWGSANLSTLWLEWLSARGHVASEWDLEHVASKKRR